MKNMRPYVRPLQLNRSVGHVLHTAGDRSTPNPRSFVPPIAPTQERASPAVQHIRSVYTAETRSAVLCRFAAAGVRCLRRSVAPHPGIAPRPRVGDQTWVLHAPYTLSAIQPPARSTLHAVAS